MKIRLSAVVITYNEEKNIARCLDSLQGVADEIVVVDSFSTDSTKEICLENGVMFFEHAFEGHIQQKNYAIAKARHDCVLFLDADECLSQELQEEIKKIKHNWQHDGYYFNRLTNYCGKWITHCGWYPDKKLRMWKRDRARVAGKNPHDIFVIGKNATSTWIKKDILHYSYYSISDHILQTNKFSEIEAKATFARGKKINTFSRIVLYPVFVFLQKYFLKLGILDGYYGFVISIISAFGKFLKYAKLKELQK